MFSSWMGSKELTRFEKNADLKPLYSNIEAIKRKAATLKNQLPKDTDTQHDETFNDSYLRDTKQEVWIRRTLAKQEVLANY